MAFRQMLLAEIAPAKDEGWQWFWAFRFGRKTIVLSTRSVIVPKGEKMSFSQTLLPEFDEEMNNTRKLLACVPDGKFDYQPHPKSMTLGRLASHVAEMPSWAVHALDREVLDLPADAKPRVASNRAELVEMFD